VASSPESTISKTPSKKTEAEYEAEWKADVRTMEKELGLPPGDLDEPYDPEMDGGREECWNSFWRAGEADYGREWMEQYGRANMNAGLFQLFNVQLPEDWDPPPPLTDKERRKILKARTR